MFWKLLVVLLFTARAESQGLESCSSIKNLHCFNDTTYQRCYTYGQQIVTVGNPRVCTSGTICSETVGSSVCVSESSILASTSTTTTETTTVTTPTTSTLASTSSRTSTGLQSCSSTKNVHCFNGTTYQSCFVSGQTIVPVGSTRNCAAGTVCSESTGNTVCISESSILASTSTTTSSPKTDQTTTVQTTSTTPTTVISTTQSAALIITTIAATTLTSTSSTTTTTSAGLPSCNSTKNVHCFNETAYQRCIVAGQRIVPVGSIRNCASGTICSKSTGSTVCIAQTSSTSSTTSTTSPTTTTTTTTTTTPSTTTTATTTTTTSTSTSTTVAEPNCYNSGVGNYSATACNQYYGCVQVMWWYTLILNNCTSGQAYSANTRACIADTSCIV